MINKIYRQFFVPAMLVACSFPVLALDAVPALSGAWYDPAHEGEGFIVEVLDGEAAVVYWFTYDANGAQRWFVSAAEVQDDKIFSDVLLQTSGAEFGENFDPEQVVYDDVGEITIQWSDCDTAVVSYIVNGTAGQQDLSRLTSIQGLDCGDGQSPPSHLTGSWYDPTHQGEGLVIEALNNDSALVYWFSYDPVGNQAWFFGLAATQGTELVLDRLITTRGGRFGPDFDPATVEHQDWGSIRIELDCSFGKLDYVVIDQEIDSGKQTLNRLTSPGNPGCEEAPAPNILMIIADDLGLDASSLYAVSGEQPATPTLDGLATEGLVFENAWSNPTCSPTRAGILTGKYGFRTGVLQAGDSLDIDETSLQSFVHAHLPGKYSDAVIGKWHLGPERGGADHPTDLGVGYFAGLPGGGLADYENWQLTENGVSTPQTTYSTTRFTDLASDWIDEQEKPWFLWLAFNAPHTPFHLPPVELHNRILPGTAEDIAANPRPYYFAAIEAMDHEIERLLAGLSPADRENTIIIFLGDNGTPSEVVQEPYERRKAKGSLNQGGINVPMFISGPGISRKGERSSALINTTDLFSTIAALAGVNVEDVHDSSSFTALLSDDVEHLRWFQYADKEMEELESWAISDGRYKLIEDALGDLALFDLLNDPWEDADLVGTPGEPTVILQELVELAASIRNSSEPD